MKWIMRRWETRPLLFIMAAAMLLRLISVIWARGFGMHDDHFLVIEAAQSWVDGSDYNNWLPDPEGQNQPQGHSFFYVGLHYFLLKFLTLNGIIDPSSKMLIVRLLHAFLSLATIWFGYRMVRILAGKPLARLAGILLAFYWFQPWLSVRNLVEVACIPFLMGGTYYAMLAGQKERSIPWFLLAGLMLGLAFNIRYQTMLFSGGLILALWIERRWWGGLLTGSSLLLTAALIQGIPDYLIWGQPFAEFAEYVRYNMAHSGDYISGPWYMYLLLITGILIPPMSIFLIAGYIRGWRKHLILFLPALLFLIFHSIFPNKQERFILPFIPFLIAGGVAGWALMGDLWRERFTGTRWRTAWAFFWVLNMVLLIPVSAMYSKRARVESMRYLSVYPDIRTIIVDERPRYGIKYPPEFYLGQWISVIERPKEVSLEDLKTRLSHFEMEDHPRFVLFMDEQDLVDRVREMQTLIPELVFEQRIRPGRIDALLHYLNPNNANESVFIYRNSRFYPSSLAEDEAEPL